MPDFDTQISSVGADPLEQRKAYGRQTTSSVKARLGHSHQAGGRTRDVATFNLDLAIDSKLRGCDVVALRVEDVAPNGYSVDRATVRQKKTGQSVKLSWRNKLDKPLIIT